VYRNRAHHAVAPSNMRSVAPGTKLVVHPVMSSLKAGASPNIKKKVPTDATFQLPMGWLNAEANLNICCMLVTDVTSQLPMGWLKADAL
jgi:hypothetical protein